MHVIDRNGQQLHAGMDVLRCQLGFKICRPHRPDGHFKTKIRLDLKLHRSFLNRSASHGSSAPGHTLGLILQYHSYMAVLEHTVMARISAPAVINFMTPLPPALI